MSGNKTKYVTAFYSQLDTLMNQLYEQFPEEKDIKVYQTSIHLLRAGNPTTFIRKFHSYVSPYKKKVIEYDEEFFLQKDYGEYQHELTLMESIRIQKIWKSNRLSAKSKKAIFDFFQVLLALSTKIVEK